MSSPGPDPWLEGILEAKELFLLLSRFVLKFSGCLFKSCSQVCRAVVHRITGMTKLRSEYSNAVCVESSVRRRIPTIHTYDPEDKLRGRSALIESSRTMDFKRGRPGQSSRGGVGSGCLLVAVALLCLAIGFIAGEWRTGSEGVVGLQLRERKFKACRRPAHVVMASESGVVLQQLRFSWW